MNSGTSLAASAAVSLVLAATLSAAAAVAQSVDATREAPPTPWNVALSTGVVTGAASSPAVDSVGIQGLAGKASIYRPLSRRWEAQADGLGLIGSEQLISYAVDGGFAYNVVGGPWRYYAYGPMGGYLSANSFGVAVPILAAYQSFAVSHPKNPDSRLSGTIISMKTGIRAYKEVGSSGAITLEALYVPLSVAASIERVSYRGMELTVGWRRLL